MRNFRHNLILACAALLLAAPLAATAAGSVSAAQADTLRLAQRDGPSLSEAVSQVRRQYNGRIVSAETRMRGNREMHHIKVLTSDGKVKTVRIPGRTRGSRG